MRDADDCGKDEVVDGIGGEEAEDDEDEDEDEDEGENTSISSSNARRINSTEPTLSASALSKVESMLSPNTPPVVAEVGASPPPSGVPSNLAP